MTTNDLPYCDEVRGILALVASDGALPDVDMRRWVALLTLHPQRQQIGEQLLAVVIQTQLPDCVLRHQLLCLAACCVSCEIIADTLARVETSAGSKPAIGIVAAPPRPRNGGVQLRRAR